MDKLQSRWIIMFFLGPSTSMIYCVNLSNNNVLTLTFSYASPRLVWILVDLYLVDASPRLVWILSLESYKWVGELNYG